MTRPIAVVALLSATGLAVAGGPRPADAQSGCTPHRVTVPTLQVVADPARPGEVVTTLLQGDLVCVLNGTTVGPQRMGRIAERFLPSGGSVGLDGWASTLFMAVTEAPAGGSSPSRGEAQAPEVISPPGQPDPDEALADGELRFDQPIPYGPPETRGRTLAELIEGQPIFPPVEGLPEDLWRKPCVTCHSWDRDLLCQQGRSYVADAAAVFRHQHPYGGPYKLALMRWANTGCN